MTAGRARFSWLLAVAGAVLLTSVSVRADPAFKQWLEQIWPEAERIGVSRATFDAATHNLEPDLTLPDLVLAGKPEPNKVKGQPEFLRPPAEYLSDSTLTRLANSGRVKLFQNRKTLAAIESKFGVPASMVVAVWGRESDYGNYRLPHNAIRVLATEAYLGRRKDMFRKEFLLALKLVEEGHVTIPEMHSSWAGAMGPTQFLPSDFYNFAVDFDGDGRKNVWTSIPDALASAAKQLLDYGWQRGERWGYEVRLTKDVDCTMANAETTRPVGEWLELGFNPTSARTLSPDELRLAASLLLPAGVYGPAFLTLKNFQALRRYNSSDLYAIFVGHLSDRINGAKPFATPWAKLTQLEVRSVEEMQKYLSEQEYYHDAIDGKAGARTRLALGLYQKKNRLKLDCWPTASILKDMRARPRQPGQ
jgi:lytic murein transglycosylase